MIALDLKALLRANMIINELDLGVGNVIVLIDLAIQFSMVYVSF